MIMRGTESTGWLDWTGTIVLYAARGCLLVRPALCHTVVTGGAPTHTHTHTHTDGVLLRTRLHDMIIGITWDESLVERIERIDFFDLFIDLVEAMMMIVVDEWLSTAPAPAP